MSIEGRSEEKTDWLGNKYIVHYDADGNKIGESREVDGPLWGSYTRHEDADGNKVGESRGIDDSLLGSYTRHEDADGNKVGGSRDIDDSLLGSYTRHEDVDGIKIGESREAEGLLGDKYVEHSEYIPGGFTSDDTVTGSNVLPINDSPSSFSSSNSRTSASRSSYSTSRMSVDNGYSSKSRATSKSKLFLFFLLIGFITYLVNKAGILGGDYSGEGQIKSSLENQRPLTKEQEFNDAPLSYLRSRSIDPSSLEWSIYLQWQNGQCICSKGQQAKMLNSISNVEVSQLTDQMISFNWTETRDGISYIVMVSYNWLRQSGKASSSQLGEGREFALQVGEVRCKPFGKGPHMINCGFSLQSKDSKRSLYSNGWIRAGQQ